MTDLTMTRGDTATFTMTLTDGAGDPLDLSTLAAMHFTAKNRLDDPEPTIEKTLGAGIAIISAPDGTARLTIDPDDTADLVVSSLRWDLQVVGAGDDVRTPLTGLLAITPDVTRDVP